MLEILKYLKARYMTEKAQGIVEYALVLAFVVVVAVAIGSSGSLTSKVSSVFTAISGSFASGSATK